MSEKFNVTIFCIVCMLSGIPLKIVVSWTLFSRIVSGTNFFFHNIYSVDSTLTFFAQLLVCGWLSYKTEVY